MSVAMRKSPVVGQLKVRTPLQADRAFLGVVGLGGDGDSANCHQLHRPGSSIEGAYEHHYFGVRQVGSYRGAAELCGTTHKTVRRVVERAEAGGSTLRACGGHVISTWSPS